MSSIGVAAARVDTPDKATGRARFISDVVVPGMAHAKLWRSPVAPNPRALALVPREPARIAVASMQTGQVELFDRFRWGRLLSHQFGETPVGRTQLLRNFGGVCQV